MINLIDNGFVPTIVPEGTNSVPAGITAVHSYPKARNKEVFRMKQNNYKQRISGYSQAWKFYVSMGLRPFEFFTHVWDDNNPRVFMLKSINTRSLH